MVPLSLDLYPVAAQNYKRVLFKALQCKFICKNQVAYILKLLCFQPNYSTCITVIMSYQNLKLK